MMGESILIAGGGGGGGLGAPKTVAKKGFIGDD